MKLTPGAQNLIKTLNSAGFEGYAVGGFTRNMLLGIPVSDVDVTTNATPQEMLEVFQDFKVYLTGLKHGTITVNSLGEHIEVTTYRVDGSYKDGRHPDNVLFVRNLSEDLARRDFTVNAMAYDGEKVIDLFGGQADLKSKLIRAVGDPDVRFQEDALRILRALRFASVLGFEIETETAKAIDRNVHLLKNVSKERIFAEMTKILLGKGVETVLLRHKSAIFEVIPELKLCDGFNQKSKYHQYDVYKHIVKSVSASKPDRTVRWALLLHDVQKPACYTEDENGVGHFYYHQIKSAVNSVVILKRLKADNELIKDCNRLIYLHDCKTELTRQEIKKFLSKNGVKTTKLLLQVKLGDAYAHAEPYATERIESIERFSCTLDDILKNKECFSLKNLAVDGNDIKMLGFSGAQIKEKLDFLLNEVIFDRLKNEKETLLLRLNK